MGTDRLRWKLWSWLIKAPGICPAGAHGLLIWRTREDPRIGRLCRSDAARNGRCWCGRIDAYAASTGREKP